MSWALHTMGSISPKPFLALFLTSSSPTYSLEFQDSKCWPQHWSVTYQLLQVGFLASPSVLLTFPPLLLQQAPLGSPPCLTGGSLEAPGSGQLPAALVEAPGRVGWQSGKGHNPTRCIRATCLRGRRGTVNSFHQN